MATTPYVDLNTIHNPTTGGVPPALWGDTVRDNLEALARPPRCKLGGSHVASNTTWEDIPFTVSEYDSDGFLGSLSDDFITIPSGLGGWYRVEAMVSWSPAAGGISRVARIYVNGAVAQDSTRGAKRPSTGNDARVYTFEDLLLNPGDTVTSAGYQDSGGTLSTGQAFQARLIAWA